MARWPKLAVWKLASCDGCQLSVLDCENELLALAGKVDFAYFLEASSARVPGPYDLSLVEGSITTAEDADRIRRVRHQSRRLVTIGACATAGGIQALRNFADVEDFLAAVYASPEYVSTLSTSTAIPPWLLRLLRPDGDAAAGGAQPVARRARDAGGRPRARVPDVQRERRAVPHREPSA